MLLRNPFLLCIFKDLFSSNYVISTSLQSCGLFVNTGMPCAQGTTHWLHFHTDGTSVGNTKLQDVTIQIPEGEEMWAILLAAGIVFQNEKTTAVIGNTVDV